jgi:hypothetical protein
MREYIKFWENNKSVECYLRAYGDAGSFNDVTVGGNGNNGIWKDYTFGYLQTLTCSLVKGDDNLEIKS